MRMCSVLGKCGCKVPAPSKVPELPGAMCSAPGDMKDQAGQRSLSILFYLTTVSVNYPDLSEAHNHKRLEKHKNTFYSD